MITIYGFIAALSLIFTIVYKKLPSKIRMYLSRKLSNERIISGLRKLKPTEDLISSLTDFTDRRIMLTAVFVTVGSLLVLAVEIRSFGIHELLEGNIIKRNGYLGGSKDIKLKVRRLEDEDREELSVTVSDKKYPVDELISLASEAQEILTDLLKADNPSVDEVTGNLYFPKNLEGYPFKITYLTSDPLLIDNTGLIKKERFERIKKDRDVYQGIPVNIHIEFTYEDFVQESDQVVRIFPEDINREMTLSEYLGELIRENDKEEREGDYLKLPDEAGGSTLVYEEVKDQRGIILFILSLILGLCAYLKESEDLKKKVKEREKELIGDYPTMVNKFLLFYSAGLTTRGIVARLCREYRISLEKGKKKRYLYEEMLICEGHMNEGMGEITAYEGFAAGLGLHKYRHFVSLVTQAIGKGRNDLMIQLEREANEAFADRKNRAKKLGEEAGTKLLFPMLMMLFTVLIVVMVPAFISFRF